MTQRVTFEDAVLLTPSTVGVRATAGGEPVPDMPGLRVGPYSVERMWHVKVSRTQLEVWGSASQVSGRTGVRVILSGRMSRKTGKIHMLQFWYDTPPGKSAAAANAMASALQLLDRTSEPWVRMRTKVRDSPSLQTAFADARSMISKLLAALKKHVNSHLPSHMT
jgi:hypothetical protein